MAKRLTERKKKRIERTAENNRSYKALVYNRAIVCILFALLQVGVSVALLCTTDFGLVWQTVAGVLALLVVLYLAGREQRHPTQTLWIILLLVAPIVGLPLYLLYGDGRPNVALKKRYEKARHALREFPTPKQSPQVGHVGCFLKNEGYPTYFDGEISYYPTGRALYEGMLEGVRSANKFIFLEYFIVSGGKMWNGLLKELLKKAENGVEIKIIYDDFGSIFSLPPRYARYLEGLHKNIKCLPFNKVYPIFTARYNHRDHRKILVVDGKLAFTGGANLADEYIGEKIRFGYWKDTGVCVRGEAAAGFTKIFLETWLACKEPSLEISKYFGGEHIGTGTGKIIPCADSPLDRMQVSECLYLEMIHAAKRRLYITTPYLALDDRLKTSLCMAAARGVDVRIITPGIPDKKLVYRLTRANYAPLLAAGVKIYEYSPGFMHAKMTLSDDTAAVGTANYDYRSLYLHFENLVYFEDKDGVAAVAQDMEETLAVCRERTKENTRRSLFGRLIDLILKLFEPLL